MAFRGTSLTSFSLCVSAAVTLLLTGCSTNFAPSDAVQPEQDPVGLIQGSVRGGQAPIAGGHIYLYAAGTAGYGSAATSLIAASQIALGATLPSGVSEDSNNNGYVTTDASGNFALSGDYSCTVGTQVYMVAVAGDPGLGGTTTATWTGKTTSITATNAAVVGVGVTVTGTGIASGTTVSAVNTSTNVVTLSQKTTGSGTNVTLTLSAANNPYIVQMAGLGECPSSGSLAQQDPYVVINEISTVAFAYAMSPFESTDEYHIGSTSTTAGKLAIHNAMADVANLVSLPYGQALSTIPGNSNTTVPTAKILHLANILATCVNTSGLLKNSGNTQQPCYTLFNDTGATITGTGSGTTTSSDEAQAIFYIAQNPTANVTALYNLVGSTYAFNDTMTGAPTDWTLPIIYNGAVSVFAASGGSNIAGPFNIAIDASGNAWIGDRVKGVVEIGLQGTVNTYNHSFAMIKGVAIDSSGNVWAADYQGDKVYIMAPTGTINSTLSTAGFNGPASIAFNSTGNAYIVNEGGVSVTVYNSTGTTVLNQSSFASLNIQTPDVIAIDGSGNAWITSTGTGDVGELTPAYVASNIVLNNLGGSYWLGFDSSADMWIGDINNNELFRGTLNVSKGTYTFVHSTNGSGGVSFPDLSAIDGAGTVWIPNKTAPGSNASVISAWAGGTGGAFATTTGYATTGTGGAVATAIDLSGNVWVANEDGSVSELIGLGTPTASPLTPSNAGTKP